MIRLLCVGFVMVALQVGGGSARAEEPEPEPSATPLRLCLAPPLCVTPGRRPRVTGVSVGLLSTQHTSMTGVEVAGLVSVTERDVVGIQATGLVATTKGDVWGLQATGLFNYVTEGDVYGVQAALGNYVQGHATGILLGGGHVVTGEMRGLQVSVLNTYELGAIRGREGRSQGACYGACVAIALNHHRRLGGLQAG
ncbi:MAG: hypothetical protein AAF602_07865, partial [Myxococcota bacterium]